MSDDGFDPTALANAAVGADDTTESAASGDPPTDAGADQAEDVADVDDTGGDGGGPIATLRDRLFATEPNPPLDDPDLSAFDAEAGGLRRFKRGVYKFAGVEGATALEDMALGLVEHLEGGDALASATSSTTDQEDDGDGADVGPLVESGAVA